MPLDPTGFNPGFGQSPFGGNGFNASAPPPPVPPLPSQPSVNTNPANIFAQMKSGTFAQDDAPQSADKYDALRPNRELSSSMLKKFDLTPSQLPLLPFNPLAGEGTVAA